MALPVPTKSLLKTSPDAAMLFAHFGCPDVAMVFAPLMPTCRSGLEFWKWRPYKVRSLVSNSIYAKKG